MASVVNIFDLNWLFSNYSPHTGLLVGRGKKAEFRGIFRGKFAEKMADFAGILREFLRPVSLKYDW